MKKIILVILTILIITGCNDNEKPIDVDFEDTKIIKIQDNLKINTPQTQFQLIGITENSKLAITTNYANGELSTGNGELTIPKTSDETNEENQTNSNNNNININISNELLLDLTYIKGAGEEPKKIELTDLQIKSKPKIGTLKIYAIKDGDNYSYIDFMRKNEIKGNTEFTQDILGNKLIDGNMSIIFSSTIEDITKVSFEQYHSQNIKEILTKNDITEKDLSFSIYFEIVITTDKGQYYLPFEYENNGKNILSQNFHQFTLNNSINFIKK